MNSPSCTKHSISSIVVVAKCPIPGKSKTRLIPLLGECGSVQLAKAMLVDILIGLSKCHELLLVDKILYYAPPNVDGENIMLEIMESAGVERSAFTLLPMQSNSTENNMTSTNLGFILEAGLIVARERQHKLCVDNNYSLGHVIFLGMDSPELPLDELIAVTNYGAHNEHTNSPAAVLLPADDGGYGMLAVPFTADPRRTFYGVRWSDPLTAVSQMKALTDQSITVIVGRLVHDIDEPNDVHRLCERLRQLPNSIDRISKTPSNNESNNDVLSKTSPLVDQTINSQVKDSNVSIAYSTPCQYTRLALIELGILQPIVE